ncbi:MAG: hypothetical protein ACRBBV_13940 [Paracoccaceae bacterium]
MKSYLHFFANAIAAVAYFQFSTLADQDFFALVAWYHAVTAVAHITDQQ